MSLVPRYGTRIIWKPRNCKNYEWQFYQHQSWPWVTTWYWLYLTKGLSDYYRSRWMASKCISNTRTETILCWNILSNFRFLWQTRFWKHTKSTGPVLERKTTRHSKNSRNFSFKSSKNWTNWCWNKTWKIYSRWGSN